MINVERQNVERQEVLCVLRELSEHCPEYRFGQLIANLAFLARGDAEGAIWDMEDGELLAAARKHLEDWRQSHAPVGYEHSGSPNHLP